MKLPIHSIDDLKVLGSSIAKSGLLKCSNEEQGFIIACICFNDDIGILEFDATYDLLNGKIAKKSSAILESFFDLGGKIEIKERSRTRAAAKFSINGTALEDEITMETVNALGFAKGKDGKLKSTWSDFPHSMLWARLCSDCIRAICPKALGGLYATEEVQDFFKDEKPVEDSAVEAMAELEELELLVCPEKCGSLSGKMWTDGDLEVLEKYLYLTVTNPEMLDPKYAPFIQKAINQKEKLNV